MMDPTQEMETTHLGNLPAIDFKKLPKQKELLHSATYVMASHLF